jgi:AraC-like DNA-binding protein
MNAAEHHLPIAHDCEPYGNMLLDTTYSNLHFHCSDIEEQTSKNVTDECFSGISIGVLLTGRLEFSLDDKHFVLDSNKTNHPICFAYSLLRPTEWSRRLIKGNQVKKAVLTLPEQWLKKATEKSCELDQVTAALHLSHACLFHSKATNQQVKLVKQLIEFNSNKKSSLEIESISLQIVIEGLRLLKSTITAFNEQNLLTTPSSRESIQIKTFIDNWLKTQDPMQPLSLKVIAQKLGASISTIQRQFQRSYNKSIVEYVRCCKLDLARENLVKGLKIGEVAYLSGYVHTSNFTTAFKRQFGKTPKQVMTEKLDS